MITTTNIDRSIGIVNRLHYFYPDSQLSFKFVWAACCEPGNQITGKQDKIDALILNLSDKLSQDGLIDAISVTTTIAGNDKFPGPLGKTCRSEYPKDKDSKNELHCNRLSDSLLLLKKVTIIPGRNVIVCYT